jgi:hypothetical protein
MLLREPAYIQRKLKTENITLLSLSTDLTKGKEGEDKNAFVIMVA